jgi:tellurite resistance protein TerC
MGLRSLYFALSGMMDKFHYLKFGLALVLLFIGAKMLLAGVFYVPVWVSLAVIVALLAGAVAASLLRRPPSSLHAAKFARAARSDRAAGDRSRHS